MTTSIAFGWLLLFAAAYCSKTVEDEDTRIALVTIMSCVAIGCFLGHFLDAVFG